MFFCSNTTTGMTNSMMKSTWNGRNKFRLPSVAASARTGEITGDLLTCQTLTGQQWLRSTALSTQKGRVQKLQDLVSLLQLGRRCTSTVQAHAVSWTLRIKWSVLPFFHNFFCLKCCLTSICFLSCRWLMKVWMNHLHTQPLRGRLTRVKMVPS